MLPWLEVLSAHDSAGLAIKYYVAPFFHTSKVGWSAHRYSRLAFSCKLNKLSLQDRQPTEEMEFGLYTVARGKLTGPR